MAQSAAAGPVGPDLMPAPPAAANDDVMNDPVFAAAIRGEPLPAAQPSGAAGPGPGGPGPAPQGGLGGEPPFPTPPPGAVARDDYDWRLQMADHYQRAYLPDLAKQQLDQANTLRENGVPFDLPNGSRAFFPIEGSPADPRVPWRRAQAEALGKAQRGVSPTGEITPAPGATTATAVEAQAQKAGDYQPVTVQTPTGPMVANLNPQELQTFNDTKQLPARYQQGGGGPSAAMTVPQNIGMEQAKPILDAYDKAAEDANNTQGGLVAVQRLLDQASGMTPRVGRWGSVVSDMAARLRSLGMTPEEVEGLGLGNAANSEALKKIFWQNTLHQLRAGLGGGREAGFIVQQATSANPSLDTQPETIALMTNIARQNAQRAVDKRDYAYGQAFSPTAAQGMGGLWGTVAKAGVDFDRQHSPESYALAGMALTPGYHQKAWGPDTFMGDRANPTNTTAKGQQIFDAIPVGSTYYNQNGQAWVKDRPNHAVPLNVATGQPAQLPAPAAPPGGVSAPLPPPGAPAAVPPAP